MTTKIPKLFGRNRVTSSSNSALFLGIITEYKHIEPILNKQEQIPIYDITEPRLILRPGEIEVLAAIFPPLYHDPTILLLPHSVYLAVCLYWALDLTGRDEDGVHPTNCISISLFDVLAVIGEVRLLMGRTIICYGKAEVSFFGLQLLAFMTM